MCWCLMSDLAEAIEIQERQFRQLRQEPDAITKTIMDAARRVLEGEQVQWCEEHYSVTWDDWQTENYLYCQRNREGYLGRCSIVLVRLVRDG